MRGFLAGAALAIATFVAYAPALRGGFIWDDDAYVTENANLRSLHGLARIWLEPGATPQYYPLVHTSYWLEYRLYGLEATGYHAVNVVLHVVAALLLVSVLRRLDVPGAWLAAGVFALHPVHVESVAWITERKNVLSAVLYLASFRSYLEFALPRAGRVGAWRHWAWASVLFLGALLSKTVSASLPAALLLVVWWKRGRLAWCDVIPLLPLFAVGAALGLHTAVLERTHVGAQGPEWDSTFPERCLVAGRAFWFYLGKLVWPRGLCFVYPRWQLDPASPAQWLWPAAALGATALLLLMRRRLGRGPLAAWLFFGGTLFPALGFLDVFPQRFSWVADHFQYLASLGPVALFAATATLAGRRLAGTAVPGVAAVLLLAVLGTLSFERAGVYRDVETLWRDTLVRNPDSYLAHTNLGNLLLERDDEGGALAHYREALRVKPEDAIAANNLAWLRATAAGSGLRDPGEAVRLAEQAARSVSYANPAVLDTLAASYASTGRFRAAIATAQRGLDLAEKAGDVEQTWGLRERLRLYRARRPYRRGGDAAAPGATDASVPD